MNEDREDDEEPSSAGGFPEDEELELVSTEQEVGETGEIRFLRQERARLEETNENLNKVRRELDERISKLLGELSEQRRDRSRTYVADAAQPHLVAERLRVWKDQALRAVSREVCGHSPSPETPSPAWRRETQGKVRSVLSQALVDACRRQEVAQRATQLKRLLASLADVGIANHRYQAVTEILAPELEAPPKVRDPWESLGLEPPPAEAEVHANLTAFLQRNDEIVALVRSTDPPGKLWIAEEGEPFDPSRHEAEPFCEEGGYVVRTSAPGYQVADRVLVKAVVFTGEPTADEAADDEASAEPASAELLPTEASSAEPAAGEPVPDPSDASPPSGDQEHGQAQEVS